MRPFRILSALLLLVIGVWFAAPSRAADDPFHNYLYNTCLETEAYWIG